MQRGETGSPGKPCRPRGVSVTLRTTRSNAWGRVPWSRRTWGRRTGSRRRLSPVAVERVLGGRCRGRAVVPAPSLARRTWRLGVEGVRAVWSPAAALQPVLASRPVIAARYLAVRPAVPGTVRQAAVARTAVPRTAVRRAAFCRASAREVTVSRAAVDLAQGGAEVRGELAWRACWHRRAGRLAEPLLTRWYFARAPPQLAVVVLGLPVRSGPFGLLVVREGRQVYAIRWQGGVRSVGMVAPLVPGQAVRVTAEAGIATFHQIPPGLCVQPHRGTVAFVSRV